MRRVIAYVLLLISVTACTVWEVQEVTPQQLLERESPPDRLRVTLFEIEDSWVILEEPRISGDSLIGTVRDGRYRGQRVRGGLATSLHLDHVARVEVPEETGQMPAGNPLAGAGIAALLNAFAKAMVENAFKSWGPP